MRDDNLIAMAAYVSELVQGNCPSEIEIEDICRRNNIRRKDFNRVILKSLQNEY